MLALADADDKLSWRVPGWRCWLRWTTPIPWVKRWGPEQPLLILDEPPAGNR